jgi:hypothetical protein
MVDLEELETRLRRDAQSWRSRLDSPPVQVDAQTFDTAQPVDSARRSRAVTQPRRRPWAMVALIGVVAAISITVSAIVADRSPSKTNTGGGPAARCPVSMTTGGVIDFQSRPGLLSVELRNSGDRACRLVSQLPRVQVLDANGSVIGTLSPEHPRVGAAATVTVPAHGKTSFEIAAFQVCLHKPAAQYSLRIRLLSPGTPRRSATINDAIGVEGGPPYDCASSVSAVQGQTSDLAVTATPTNRPQSLLIATFRIAGGPPPGNPRPAQGVIVVHAGRSPHGRTVATAPSDARGQAEFRLPHGTYVLTTSGQSSETPCTTSPPVTVTTHPVRVTLTCAVP